MPGNSSDVCRGVCHRHGVSDTQLDNKNSAKTGAEMWKPNTHRHPQYFFRNKLYTQLKSETVNATLWIFPGSAYFYEL